MLGAYLDDSGTHDGSEVSVVAGYLAPVTEWESLEADWAAVLQGEGIPFFHAAPCEHGKDHFKGMSRKRRNQIRERLIESINRHEVIGIGSAVSMTAFQGAVAPSLRGGHFDPYLLNIQNVVMTLCEFAAKEYPGDGIVLTVERKPKFDGRVRQAYDALKETTPWPLDSLALMEKRDRGALQCADLLAYETHVEMRYRLETPRRREIRQSFLALLRNRLEGNYFDSENVLALLLEHIQRLSAKDQTDNASLPSI